MLFISPRLDSSRRALLCHPRETNFLFHALRRLPEKKNNIHTTKSHQKVLVLLSLHSLPTLVFIIAIIRLLAIMEQTREESKTLFLFLLLYIIDFFLGLLAAALLLPLVVATCVHGVGELTFHTLLALHYERASKVDQHLSVLLLYFVFFRTKYLFLHSMSRLLSACKAPTTNLLSLIPLDIIHCRRLLYTKHISSFSTELRELSLQHGSSLLSHVCDTTANNNMTPAPNGT